VLAGAAAGYGGDRRRPVTANEHLFTGIRGTELPTITYRRAWTAARKAALTPEEQKSPLARRPYDLRHACLSTWLNGGVPATQVAEWAGHGVDVLLRIYARCIVGQHEIAKRRISETLRDIEVQREDAPGNVGA
jgi:integrase